jgi:hypothetical protein
MSVPNAERNLNADHRRALRVLAANPDGRTEAIMLAHGFKPGSCIACKSWRSSLPFCCWLGYSRGSFTSIDVAIGPRCWPEIQLPN